MRRPRTDLDPELASAAKHRANADRLASAAIAELVRLGVHAMKAQEQSQGSKPEICGVGIPILHRHFNSTLRGYRPRSMFLLVHSQDLIVRTQAPSAWVRKRIN